MRTQVKRAFTLIEILIVVVILCILAAIVIPQFTDASQQASNSSLQSQLQTIPTMMVAIILMGLPSLPQASTESAVHPQNAGKTRTPPR